MHQSLKVLGNPSSALITTYFSLLLSLSTERHLMKEGNPAPPLPSNRVSSSILTNSALLSFWNLEITSSVLIDPKNEHGYCLLLIETILCSGCNSLDFRSISEREVI